ncbi:MAG: glycosyltransferase [Oceanococcaceae bacterium]
MIIATALTLAVLGAVTVSAGISKTAFLLWAVSLPAFASGVLEDFRHDTSPWLRYGACLASAALFVSIWGGVPAFDVGVLDALLVSAGVGAVVSMFCIAGVTQAFNIVDGKNGLSSGMGLVALVAMTYVAHDHQDETVFALGLVIATAIGGFWVVNISRGRLFLGDSGAYLVGFLVAALGVILVSGNTEVSPWLPVLAAAFPIVETLFTFFRRVVIEQKRFSEPDFLHMHSLIYDRVFCARIPSDELPGPLANSAVSIVLLTISALVAVASTQLSHSSVALQMLFLGYVAIYLAAYRWLRLRTR